MDKKQEFNEALSALVEYATVNGNVITTDDVKEYFHNIIDDENMYTAIYSYLIESKIKLEGYTKDPIQSDPATTSNNSDIANNKTSNNTFDNSSPNDFTNICDSEEEKFFLDMYYEDLAAIPVPVDTYTLELADRVVKGDKTAVNLLVEANLSRVIGIADEYTGKGMRKADIISEGNLGLFLAVSSLKEVPSNIDDFMNESIRTAISNALDDEVSNLRISNHISERANAVNDATTHLAEKLGREATIEELSEYLSLPQEKVLEILKMSLDAVNNAVTE